MSRDGLLPEFLSRVHRRHQTPHLTTIATGIVVAIGAALFPIRVVANCAPSARCSPLSSSAPA